MANTKDRRLLLHFENLEPRHLLSASPITNDPDPGGEVDSASPQIYAASSTVVAAGSATVAGEFKKWHKLTFDFPGPNVSESDTDNPFLNYRLDVTFFHPMSGKQYVVPGFFAADGDAGNTHATSGDVWRVHFSPDEIGTWGYIVSFRTGANVAVASSSTAGASAGFFDGDVDTFTVTDTDKTGIDLRGKGRLQYVGEHYLQFAETGEFFLKQGPDAPENLLAYDDFDGNFKSDGNGDQYIKDWQPHVQDWNPGDPTWDSDDADSIQDDGKGLIGAVNYLASEGQNAFSFLTMNITGDDKNVFPYTTYSERTRMDVSRLDQWEKVFEHADHKGMYLHFKTQETENDQLLDGGALGNQRKLYYRELIARFSHHLALNWNLGEENTNTTQQIKDFAQYFHDLDPYDHNIVIHSYPNQQNQVYNPLLGNASLLTGASIQTNQENFSNVHSDTVQWVNASANAGKKWVVAVDEPGDPQHALRPDSDAGSSQVDGRKNALWGTLMAGGAGNEWYFGYGHAHSDLTLDDFRSRDNWWDTTRYALEFFKDNQIPFWDMQNGNGISTASNDYGFYKPGDTYVAYLKNGGTTNMNLVGTAGEFEVKWFDPRNGGPLLDGNVTVVSGGGSVSVGLPPNNTTQDWTVLVRKPLAVDQGPFGGVAHAIQDGTQIQFEHYDVGGEGKAYHDSDAVKVGNAVRIENVDGGTATGASGERVSGIVDGEWLEYTVNPTAGTYHVSVRYAAGATNVGDVRLLLGDAPDGGNFVELATIDLQSTGSNAVWSFATIPGIQLPGDGDKVLRVEAMGDGFDLDLVEFTTNAPVNTSPVVAIDSVAQVVDQGAGGSNVFQDQGGYVVMEVESVEPAAGWVERNTNPTGATGEGFYEWTGPNLHNQSLAGSQGVMAYTFQVDEAGTYQMRVRNHRTISNGETFDAENDIWARMDSENWIKIFSSTQNAWNWASNFDFHDPRPPASYVLSAGEHTLYIGGRSTSFRIDRIALYKGSSSAALNVNTPESPRSGGPASVVGYQIDATVTDDARINAPPALAWTKLSGPGDVTFDDPNAEDVLATFSADGQYVLQLTAFDGEFTTQQTVTIDAITAINQAPNVEAGSNRTIQMPMNSVNLNGTVSDDGLPTGNAVTTTWSVVNAPTGATVQFGDAQAIDTSATFSDVGQYTLRLSANDGELTSTDQVTVTVNSEFGSVTLTPVDDAMLQGTTLLNDSHLKVQPSGPSRVSYLKFDVTGLDGFSVAKATLRLNVNGDAGSGTINAHVGSHSTWAESTLSDANRPAAGAVVDSVTGTHSIGQWKEFDVTSVVTGNGQLSFVVQMLGGGNDVWFSSSEGAAAPQLVVDRGAAMLLPCDYVGAGNGCDAADINALYTGTIGTPGPLSDSLIIQWLADASVADNPAKADPAHVYRLGDIDLDGDVDSTDLGVLLAFFGNTSGVRWAAGNLNSDANVDEVDLGRLLNNFGETSQAVAATSASVLDPLPSLADYVFGDFYDEDDDS